ncbi:DUF2057 domain-containing protein [Thalassotalea sp. M1531]|uniref:DUF2057 domain-containing protein n=1 Tax=Thalassotalea algicola TaxID=2716224 RepID=A0A7Y0LBV3_9GAMM|nr:DUF2057 family protein [Thalassotalea algicola]NMP31432.1 DUF2057 domain-containing protein [Thalassotalea algicola]
MKLFYFFVLFTLSFSCTAELLFPEQYQVLKVNGKDYSGSFFSSESRVELTNTKQVILYRYNELFDDTDNDDHTKIKSEPFVLIIEGTQQRLRVIEPNNLDIQQARTYALNPVLDIRGQSGQVISHTIASLIDFEQSQYQRAVNKNLIRLEQPSSALVDENVVNQPKPLKNDSLEKANQPIKAQNSRALSMLNYWWQQASEQERQQFLQQQLLIRQ